MPIVLKPNQMYYKDPDTGDYKEINVLAEEATATKLAEINAAGANEVTKVQNAGTTEKNKVDTAGATQLAAIQTKADEVTSQLASAGELEGMLAEAFSPSTNYTAGQYVIQSVTVGGNTVNKLFRFTSDHAAGEWIGTDAVEIKLGDDVADLKSAFDFLNSTYYDQYEVVSNNLFDKSRATSGYYIKTDGSFGESENWFVSNRILVDHNTAYYYSSVCEEYQADGTPITYHGINDPGLFTTDSNTAFIIFSGQVASIDSLYFNKGSNKGYDVYKAKFKSDLIQVDATLSVENMPADSKAVGNAVKPLDAVSGSLILSNNLFDANGVIYGKTINTTGVISDASATTWISSKITVIPGYNYYIWGNAAIYKEDGTFVAFHSINDAGIMLMPTTASYIICAGNSSNISSWKVNIHTQHTIDNYKTKTLFDAKINGVIVAKDGSGDYTSLTKALWDNIGKGLTFYVKPGEYDLITEYSDYFGSDVFDASKFDANNNPIEHQQWYEGLPIKNTIIYLDSLAIVKFNYTGSVQGVIDWFSPFKFIAPGGELHGGQIVCSNCRYAIHDDCYGSDYDRRITDGVYIYYRSSRNVAIGGGLGKSSCVEVKNCYVDSTGTGYGIWYHNSTLANAQNYVSIHDNYSTASIEIQALGPSTLISKALVSNNKCHSVDKIDNQTEGGIDNFAMTAWNNVTD